MKRAPTGARHDARAAQARPVPRSAHPLLAHAGQPARPDITPADAAQLARDVAATVAGADYASLRAVSAALAGISRERVQALLGLR